MTDKIAVMPCNGVGRVVSTITRESAYKIQSLRPNKTILVSSPDLAVDNPTVLSVAKKYPLIVIDGCKPKCGTNILESKGIKPAFVIYAPNVCADKKISIAGETRVKLGKKGQRLIDAIAEIAINVIDEILVGKSPMSQKNMSKKAYVDNEEVLSRL